MKKQQVAPELVQQTVDALDEVENAVLGTVQTGVKAGIGSLCPPDSCPRPLYGVSDD